MAAQTTLSCQHGSHEDCMICAICGNCDESLDDNDICDDCRTLPAPITSTRAAEIIAQHEAAFGSDISRFMTSEEAAAVRRYWLARPQNSTLRATVYRLARSATP